MSEAPIDVPLPAAPTLHVPVLRDVESITPYIRNAGGAPGRAKLISSRGPSLQFGFDQAIVVDGQGVIIKGHGRREAALRLGLKQVPVIVRTRPHTRRAGPRRAHRRTTSRPRADWTKDARAGDAQTWADGTTDLALDRASTRPRSSPSSRQASPARRPLLRSKPRRSPLDSAYRHSACSTRAKATGKDLRGMACRWHQARAWKGGGHLAEVRDRRPV